MSSISRSLVSTNSTAAIAYFVVSMVTAMPMVSCHLLPSCWRLSPRRVQDSSQNGTSNSSKQCPFLRCDCTLLTIYVISVIIPLTCLDKLTRARGVGASHMRLNVRFELFDVTLYCGSDEGLVPYNQEENDGRSTDKCFPCLFPVMRGQEGV